MLARSLSKAGPQRTEKGAWRAEKCQSPFLSGKLALLNEYHDPCGKEYGTECKVGLKAVPAKLLSRDHQGGHCREDLDPGTLLHAFG